jgi:hypothetical protein
MRQVCMRTQGQPERKKAIPPYINPLKVEFDKGTTFDQECSEYNNFCWAYRYSEMWVRSQRDILDEIFSDSTQWDARQF